MTERRYCPCSGTGACIWRRSRAWTSFSLACHFLRIRLPKHLEPSRLVRRADVREPQEVEGLGLSLAPALSVWHGEPPKLDQPGLFRVQLQSELRHPLAKIVQEPLGFRSMLESNNEVVGVAHDDHVPVCPLPSPLLDPQVERVVQVEIGQKRADASALNRPSLATCDLPVLQHTGSEPLLDQPHDAPVPDPVLDERDQPLVSKGVKKRRRSASSTQFTFFVNSAVRSAASA